MSLLPPKQHLMAKRHTEAVPLSGLQDDDANILAHEDASSGLTEREYKRAISFELHLLRLLKCEELVVFGAALGGHKSLPFRRGKTLLSASTGSSPM